MDLDTRARTAAQGLRRAVEVMEMSTDTQQPRKVERFDKYQDRKNRNRKMGALAVAAAIVAVLVLLAVTTFDQSDTSPAGTTPPPIPPGSAFTVNVYTGAMTALSGPMATQGNDFAVSPDGTKVAYTNCCGAPLHLANIDGTDDQVITPVGYSGLTPIWSPDGSMLVFQQRPSTIGSLALGNLYVYDLATGTTRRLTNLDQTQSWGWWMLFPSFSWDSRWVLYQVPRGDPHSPVWDLWSVRAPGGQPSLTQHNAGWGASSGSLGLSFAYVSPINPRTFAGNKILIHTPGDEGSVPVTTLVRGNRISWLRFSPTGSWIAYVQGNDVYVVGVPSGTVVRIAAGNSPEWVDNNTLVMGAPG